MVRDFRLATAKDERVRLHRAVGESGGRVPDFYRKKRSGSEWQGREPESGNPDHEQRFKKRSFDFSSTERARSKSGLGIS